MARGILTGVIGNVIPALSALVSAPVLALSLGVAGRGQLAAATSPYLLAVTIATLGIPDALTYLVARRPHVVRAVVWRSAWIQALAGIVVSAILIALSSPLSGGSSQVRSLMLLTVLPMTPALLLGSLRGVASGLQLWRAIALERILSSVGKLGAFILLAAFGSLTPITGTIVVVASPLLGAIPYLSLLSRRGSSRARVEDAGHGVIMSYAIRVWGGSLAGTLLSRLDQTLMLSLSSAEQLGYYAVAVSISEVLLIVNAAVSTVVFSSDARSQDDERLGAAARISSSITVLLAAVIAFSMYAWVPVLFGQQFSAAIPVTWVLLVAVALGNPGSVAGSSLSARGAPGARTTSLVIACIANIVGLYLLVPTFGAMGAALCTLGGNLLAGGTNIIWLKVRFGVPLRLFAGLRRQDIQIFLGSVRRLFMRVSNSNAPTPARAQE
jgi:O-antigen/teichoic acid export membrane protein